MHPHSKFSIRHANHKDVTLILTLIKELAAYEKMEQEGVATELDVEKTLFGEENPAAKVLIAEENNTPVGFALYFYNYSTFLCKYGIYIEDIYVREDYGGRDMENLFFSIFLRSHKKKIVDG